MDTRRRRTGPRKPAQAADKPKPKRPIQKDMTVYARHMRLPQYNGITFTAVAKRDVSFDVRAMAGLPIPSTIDPEAADAYLQTNRDSGTTWDDGAGLLPKPLVQAMRGSRPQPDAYPLNGMATNTDEKPEIIAHMEAYAFRGEEDESYWASDEEFNDYALPPPSRWMSGWTAARIAAEGGKTNVHRAPLSSTGSASAASGLASAVTFGQPRGAFAGEALGMDGALLDLGLLDRLQAVLPVKRAFMETRYLSLRRQYVGALKEYFLTAEEMGVSLESLREQAAVVRSVLRNGGKAQGITKPEQVAFATDVEESIAVSRVSAAMEAVVRQNAQLRARLATVTGRVSGCSTTLPDTEPQTAEEAQAASKPSADLLLVVNSSGCAISGGAMPSAGRGSTTTAQADVDMDTGATTGSSKGGHSLQLRGRAAARELPQEVLILGAFHEPVLAVGDLILTPYGRGVVMKQRDLHLLKGEASALPVNAASSSSASASPSSLHPSPQPSAAAAKGGRKGAAGKSVPGTAGASIPGAAAHADSHTSSAAGNLLAKPLVQPTTTMVEVLLRFGARASILSSQVVLLAVAGEEYHGPEAADGTLLAAVLAARAKATGRSPVLVGTAASTAYIAKADDILYGPSKPTGASAFSAGITSAEGSAALVGPAVPQAATAKSKAVIGSSLLRGVGTGEAHSTVQAEASWQAGAAGSLALHIAAEDGVVLSHKQPVFRVPWDRNTIPRGVPLHIDPLRGTSTLGYIVGTVHYPGTTTGSGQGAAGTTVQPLHGMTGPTTAEHAGSSHGSHPLASPTEAQPHAATSGSSGTLATSALPTRQGGAASDAGVGVQSGSVPRPGEATQQVRELFAEVQRLRAQLKQSEESRTEQRKRLTDARVTIARLIEQLNETRSETSELETEITRREKEVGDLQERILELRMRYEPQALAADQAREAEAAARRRERDREDGSSAAAAAASKAMEALVASMSADAADGAAGAGAGGRGLYAFVEEDGDGGHSTEPDGEEEAATTLMGPGAKTAGSGQASKSPMKPSASPAGMRPGMSSSVRKVSASGGYRGIMSTAPGDADDSEGEEEGAEGPGGLVAAGVGTGGDDVDVDDAATENTSLEDDVPDSDAGALSALIAESDLAEVGEGDGEEAMLVGALSAGTGGGPREDASTSSGGALLERAMRGLAEADDTGAGSGSEAGPAPVGGGRGRGRGAAAAARRAVGGASTRTTRTGAVKAGSKRPRSSLEEDGAAGSDAGGDNGEEAEGGTPLNSQEAGTTSEADASLSQEAATDGMADNGSSSASATERGGGGPVKKARGRPARR